MGSSANTLTTSTELMTNDTITARQARFATEYVANGLNATKAAIASGYSPRTAESQASRLLRNVKVAAFVSATSAEVMGKINLDSERTLQGVAELAFFDIRKMFRDNGTILPLAEMDEHTAAAIAGIEVTELFDGVGNERRQIGIVKKVRLTDRAASLDMLMRYHSLYKDKVEINGHLILADRIVKARTRANTS